MSAGKFVCCSERVNNGTQCSLGILLQTILCFTTSTATDQALAAGNAHSLADVTCISAPCSRLEDSETAEFTQWEPSTKHTGTKCINEHRHASTHECSLAHVHHFNWQEMCHSGCKQGWQARMCQATCSQSGRQLADVHRSLLAELL